MTTSIAGIMALLKTKIEGVKIGGVSAFGVVLDHADGDFINYPAAVITESGGKGSVMDTHHNERIMQFSIKLYQEQSRAGKDKKKAADTMRAITDAVLVSFDRDKDLSGAIDILRVVEFDTTFKVAAGTFNFATLRVEAVVLVLNHN